MAHFTTSDGLSLHYTDDGTGLPLLCLAGLTRTGADFDYLRPHLTDIRLITLDYRGRGQSDFDPDWTNYALPVEGRDVLELLAHLGLAQVAILGTSRGGMNAMGLAAVAKDWLLGVALNDIGPAIDPAGIEFIMTYLGRNPAARTHADAATSLAHAYSDFTDVPPGRWLAEAQKNFTQTADGLQITYDPHLRDAVAAAADQPMPDLWPFFDAMAGLPLACIRGANSNLFTPETLAEMVSSRPDMIVGEVPGRGHAPFLDEPVAVEALNLWLEKMR